MLEKKSYAISNCFKSRDPIVLMKAFTTFVRPILEYCSSLWSPYSALNIKKIESIQKKFTKRLCGMENLSYYERLLNLATDTLELRRLKNDLCMYYRIVHNLADLPLSDFFELKTTSTRSNGLSIVKPSSKTNSERYYFHHRRVDVWNSLPSCVVQAPSLASFRRQIDKLDFSTYLYFRRPDMSI